MSSRAQTNRICACCGLLHGVDFAQGHLIPVDADLCDDCKNKQPCLLKCSGEACTGHASSKKGLLACDACIAADLAAPRPHGASRKCGDGLRKCCVLFVEADGPSVRTDVMSALTNFDGRGDLIIQGAGMIGACNRFFAIRLLHEKDDDAYEALRKTCRRAKSYKGWGNAKSHTSSTGVRVGARDLIAAHNDRSLSRTTTRLLQANTRGAAHGTPAELAAKAQADAWATEPHRARTEAETERVKAEGFRVEDSEYLGREVLVPVGRRGTLTRARVRGWLDEARSNYVDSRGRPVALWRAIVQGGKSDGDDHDLELHELETSLTDAQPSAVADRIADLERAQRIENGLAGRAGSGDSQVIEAAPGRAQAAADVLASEPLALARARSRSTPATVARRVQPTPVGKRKGGQDTATNKKRNEARNTRRIRRKTKEARKAERAKTGETWREARARRMEEGREATTVGIAAARARQKQWKSCEGQGGCGDFYTKVLRCPRCHSTQFKVVSPQPPPPPSDDERNHGRNYTAPPQL